MKPRIQSPITCHRCRAPIAKGYMLDGLLHYFDPGTKVYPYVPHICLRSGSPSKVQRLYRQRCQPQNQVHCR
jgi:hypothetical protein